jgi:RNA polymerase sigma-70 factor (ECF subfamily)
MDRFGGLVWSLARRQTSGGADADDAVQEIFIDVWKSAARFDPSIASESTFVATIARRRLIDRGRRRQRRIDAAIIPEAVQPEAEPAPDLSDRNEQAVRATAALEQLRPEQQRILQLSIYHGRSHEEISRSTGLPLGTVKTHARRGLIRLREILEAEGALERGLKRDMPVDGEPKAGNPPKSSQ